MVSIQEMLEDSPELAVLTEEELIKLRDSLYGICQMLLDDYFDRLKEGKSLT